MTLDVSCKQVPKDKEVVSFYLDLALLASRDIEAGSQQMCISGLPHMLLLGLSNRYS